MDTELLKFFNTELYYLREAAAGFAEKNPQIAQQLSLEGFTCSDPYIERLLEGFAYLAARVHYELESEFEKFTQVLLNNIYPDYLMPFPSASIVKIKPDFSDDTLTKGVKIARHTVMNTLHRSSSGTPCTFTTTQDVMLWPIKIIDAYYSTDKLYNLKDIGSGGMPKSALHIELNTTGGIKFSELPVDSLDFHLHGASMKVLMDIYEQIFADLLAVVIEFEGEDSKNYRIKLPDIGKQVEDIGFKEEQSLLPHNLRNLNVYRMLKEYFCFPKKFMFFRLSKLQDSLRQIDSEKIKLSFIFKKDNSFLESGIGKNNISLFCTPVINMFKKRLDRQLITDQKTEYLINADNVKLSDYELLKIEGVEGFNKFNNRTINFRPFYQVSEYDKFTKEKSRYFNYRRQLITDNEKRKHGSETYLSIVDIHSLFSTEQMSEIAITALCSNRLVPENIQISSASTKTDFSMNEQYPIIGVKFIERPTSPNYSSIESVSHWAVINHLKVNYKNILKDNTEVIKDLLKLYATNEKLRDRKQIGGVNYAKATKDIMCIECKHGVSFGSGLLFDLGFEESYYSDSGYFILAHIIHLIIESSMSINSLIRTSVSSDIRGEIKQWKKEIL